MAGLEGLWHHLMTKYPDWIEGAWGILYAKKKSIAIVHLCPSIVHEVVYFGAFVPFWIADYIPSLQKYKIQVATLDSIVSPYTA